MTGTTLESYLVEIVNALRNLTVLAVLGVALVLLVGVTNVLWKK